MAAVLNMAEGSAPSTPAAGTHSMYVDTSGNWHILDDGGIDKTLADTGITLVTANITDEAITNAKLAHMAQATVKGRAADAGTGDPVDLTGAQVAAIIVGELSFSDTGWQTITLETMVFDTTGTRHPTALTHTAPAYRVLNGVVFLRGSGNHIATGTAFTLPAEARPAVDMAFITVRETSTVRGYQSVYITTAGIVTFQLNTTGYTTFLTGISFPAA
jgi:hypothetical protein